MWLNNLIVSLSLSSLLLASVYEINPAAQSNNLKDKYVAVFCSKEFSYLWEQYGEDIDQFCVPKKWSDLEDFVNKIKAEAPPNEPIVIELLVHGYDGGLAITDKIQPITRKKHMVDTSFGEVINTIYKGLGNRNVTILCEACFSGNAYYYTAHKNYKGTKVPMVCPYPIYGVGSGFANWGQTMFLQTLHNVRYYYEDLRSYEYRKPNPHEKEDKDHMSSTTYKLKEIFEFFYKGAQ